MNHSAHMAHVYSHYARHATLWQPTYCQRVPRCKHVYDTKKIVIVAAGKANRPVAGNVSQYDSQYKGVSWKAARSLYTAFTYNAGKKYYLGSFSDEVSAARAHDLANLRFQSEGLLDRAPLLSFPDAQYTPADIASVHIPSLQPKVPTSAFKGVCWYKATGKWMAYINHNGKRHHIGYFEAEVDAAKAHDDEIRQLAQQGMLRRARKLNFPDAGMQGSSAVHVRHQNKGITSECFGVTWHSRSSRWIAQIRHNSKQHHLGYYDVGEDAAKAYDVAVLRLRAEGRLPADVRPINFPPSSYSKEDIMSAKVPSDTAKPVSSKYYGVTWDKTEKKWRVQIFVHGRKTYLGLFNCEEDAALAYDKAVLQAMAEGGVKANRRLNFPKPENIATNTS